jgi:hypothetical protein
MRSLFCDKNLFGKTANGSQKRTPWIWFLLKHGEHNVENATALVQARHRAEAVKLATEQGMRVTQIARTSRRSMQTYATCLVRAREDKLAAVEAHRMHPASELQAEITRLKRDFAIACQ